MTPKEILEEVAEQNLGYKPFYGSIKPVHIANGFFSAVLGGYCNTGALNDIARLWERLRTYDPQTAQPFERLVDSYPVWERDAGQPGALTSLSTILMGAYGADGALFTESRLSSLTAASKWGVTGDPSHRGTGGFLLWLLSPEPHEGGEGVAELQWLRDVLEDAGDPWTLVALPLLRYQERWYDRIETKNDPVFRQTRTRSSLRRCLRRLLRCEMRQKAKTKLNSLRRVILLGCFAVYLDLISRLAEESLPEDAVQVPILLDLGGGPSVRTASHDAFRAAQQIVERYFRTIVADYLKGDFGADPSNCQSLDDIRREISSCDPQFQAVYDALAELGDPFEQLVRAVVFRGFAMSVDTPTSFMRELGRRAGFLGPWSGRGDRKRYLASADFLEVLVLATIEPGETIYFNAFLDRLLESFGIVVGRDRDVSTITRNNVYETAFGVPTFVNEDELRENKENLKGQLQDLGYARSYADGVTVIHVP